MRQFFLGLCRMRSTRRTRRRTTRHLRRAYGRRENPSFHKSWSEASPFTGEGRSRRSRSFVGGACPIPGNSTWKEYCMFLPERVELFLSVLNKLHCGANPGTPFSLSYFADGQCDLVSIAILETIKRVGKPWNFGWVSGKVKGNPHIFLYDKDVKLYIDLTARQFFSGDDMTTIAGTEEQLRELGYEFPVDEEEFREHLPTVLKEVRAMLNTNKISV